MDALTFSAFSRAVVEAQREPGEKVAIPGLHALLMGAGGHVGSNALGRAAHHSSNLADVVAHQAYQRGAGGATVAPWSLKAMKLLLGPEAALQAEAAEALGKKLYELPPQKREALMAGIGQGLAHAPPEVRQALGGAPILGPLHRAMEHDIRGTAPTFEAKKGLGGLAARAYGGAVNFFQKRQVTPFSTTAQNVAANVTGAAPAAALAAIDPAGAAAHMGWNGLRNLAGRTAVGQQIAEKQLKSGLAGVPLSPVKELANDLLVSPAFLDAHRIGLAGNRSGIAGAADRALSLGEDAHKILSKPVSDVPGWAVAAAGAAHHNPKVREAVGTALRSHDTVRNVARKTREFIPRGAAHYPSYPNQVLTEGRTVHYAGPGGLPSPA
jgi:hypothetical protein